MNQYDRSKAKTLLQDRVSSTGLMINKTLLRKDLSDSFSEKKKSAICLYVVEDQRIWR